jgi:hypothetical protein
MVVISGCSWVILIFIDLQKNRNKPREKFNKILILNNIICHLDLIKLPIKGRSYTWSNMQDISSS